MTIQRPEQPPVIAGFEHINRYWDKHQQIWAAKILPGEYFVTKTPGEAVATTLGSCVSACIRDKVFGIGGMNHFMLPVHAQHGSQDWLDEATRYGNFAMEYLINSILKAGGNRKNLEAKVTGGGNIIANMSNIGLKNSLFVLDYLGREGIPVVANDLGSDNPRKVMYYPDTGRMRVKKLESIHNQTLIQREESYRHELDVQPDSGGDIELF
jgi:chemotaxis protein CheD